MDAAAGDVALMRRALRAARAAGRAGEVPVGAIAVGPDRTVLAASGNRVERGRDAALHAEMVVLRRAARIVGGWRLTGVTVAVTLEPCPMCAGAMLLGRVARCLYGASDPRKGADGSVYDVLRHPGGNHRIEVTPGVLAGECAELLQRFFAGLRSEPGWTPPQSGRGGSSPRSPR
ncbi:MAG TPA: nucleoside deaminase [Candidatus Dormibacteraeota bacterium]|nr:nucleoside deaminase [Candidatus Dormibacteraeota bacterium]